MYRINSMYTFAVFALLISTLSTVALAQYCTPPASLYGTQYNTLIDGVELGGISNLGSGDIAGPYYTYYNHTHTALHRGTSSTLRITRGSYYSAMYYYAWIDYNQDEDFYDSGELLGSFVTNSTDMSYNITFTPPSGALTGDTRLRITCAWSVSGLGPCDAYDYGETEDYAIEISDFGSTILQLPLGGKVCAADLDGDRDEDFIVTGAQSEGGVDYFTRVYRNNGNGTFTFPGQELTSFASAEIFTGDFNNDNRVDFIISGYNYGGSGTISQSLLYQNNGGNNFSSVSNAVFPNDFRGTWEWGDYDEDGDQDLFFVGSSPNVSKLYANNGGNFTELACPVEWLRDGDADWGDYDNDGDLDLLVNGEDSISNRITLIYKNNDYRLERLNIDLFGVRRSTADWADYDSDGDLDFLITGRYTSNIYINEGNDNFSLLSTTNLTGIEGGESSWGDYDLDGDLDILVCGYAGHYEGDYFITEDISAILVNEGGNTFSRMDMPSRGLSNCSGTDWIDYDRDGDLDVLVSTHYNTRLYENSAAHGVNNVPSIPTNLTTKQIGNSLVLKWDSSTDDISPQSAIQYNVRFGVYSNADFLLSPMAHYYYGERSLRMEGNALFNTERVIHNVAPRRYYWSVQAIDGSGRASRFASSSYVDMHPFFSELFVDNTTEYTNSAVCWGDYNDDGYLDAFSNGAIFRNLGGTGFTLELSLSGPDNISHAEWVDYDNDGDLDLVYCGNNSADHPYYILSGYVMVYENNNGTFTLNTSLPFEGVARGNFIWKDFNGDGLKDFVISGLYQAVEEDLRGLTHIYINNGSGFTQLSSPLTSDDYGRVFSTDLDSDQDMDIIFTEYWGKYIRTLENDGDGNFSLLDPGFIPIAGDFAFADYDADGDMDALIAGKDSITNKRTMIWRNTGGSFENTFAPLPGMGPATINWLDTDGDRDLDLLISGTEKLFKAYHVENLGDGLYDIKEVTDIPMNSGSMKMGDHDNDGDPDVLLSGRLDGTVSVAVYNNNFNETGTNPGPPLNPDSRLEGFDVVLNWDPPDDPGGTGGEDIGYTYEVKVGHSSSDFDIIAPESNPTTGYIRTMHLGNNAANRELRIRDLPLGTYYWGVQALDPGYRAGNWTTTQSFTITQVSPEFDFDTVCMGLPTPFTDHSVTSDVISGWRWEFGDGEISTAQHPGHVYSAGGTYNVTLWAFTESGDSASVTRQVLVWESPLAAYNAAPVCDRDEMDFTDNSITGTLTGISYLWNFGDGATSGSQSSVSHLYSSPGSYNSSLSISADNGCSDVMVQEVTVAAYPEANIGLVPGYSSIFCSDTSTILAVPFHTGYNYQWQLNNEDIFGETDTSIVVKGPSGDYSVVVENPAAGCASSDNIQITVSNPPATPVILTENYEEGGCPTEEAVILSVETLETETLYQWKKGINEINGATGDSYTGFLDEGEYSVVATRNGCSSESEVLDVSYGDMPDKPSIHVSGPAVWYLACSNDSASAYRWYLNQERIAGAEEYLYVAGSQEGVFEVAIATNSTCYAVSDPVRIPLGTAINQDIWEHLKIYPNPTPGRFTLEMDNPLMGELIIDIFAESGSQIINIKFQKETAHFKTEIDLSGQPPSLYLINLMLEQNRISRTLIVE